MCRFILALKNTVYDSYIAEFSLSKRNFWRIKMPQGGNRGRKERRWGGKGKEEGEEAKEQNTGFLGPWKYSYSV